MYNNTNNSTFGGQGFYGQPQGQFGYAPMAGMANYGQAPKMPEFTNPLGEKAKELLKNGGGAPTLQITESDMNQALCTHRYNGQPTVYELADGRCKCKICGAEWRFIDNASMDEIQKATENVHDLLHTAKCQWVDIPDNVCIDNFQILAVLDKVPQICSIAADRVQRYNNVGLNPGYQNQMGNGFAALDQITGGMGMGFGAGYGYAPQMGHQQPAMGYQQPAMGGYQQPYMGQPQMGYGMPQATPMQQTMTAQAPGMNNGFGTMGGAQPAPQQPAAIQPAQAAQVNAAPAATAPAQTEEVQVSQQLHA